MLIFNDEMYSFLQFAQRESIIAALFLQGDSSHINDEGNYVKRVEDEIDVVSFLPKSKYEKVENEWESGRIKIKIGRFIRKFLTDFSIQNFNINDQMIEKFVNLYKSYFSRDISKLKIVEGEEILKYYLEDNYHSLNGNRAGSLWNSCMRQKERNKFLKLYSSNVDIKMVVMFAEDGTVRSRALLWENVCEHNTERTFKFMDRIYSIYDHDVETFKMWAKQNGYICKWEQSAKSETLFDIDGEPVRLKLFVKLENSEFSYYPYLDTFKYFNPSRNRFSNSEYYDYAYKLVQSNGQAERDSEPEEEYWDEEN